MNEMESAVRAKVKSRSGWMRSLAMTILSIALLPSLALADNTGPDFEQKNFKLTFGDYLYRDPAGNFSGQDLNLRYRRNDTSAWVGFYRDREFGEQARVGADTTWQPVDTIPISLMPSLQFATRGYVGGSFTVQAGDAWFAQAGIGRTNLRPYVNLNFDPNDAVNFGIGHHLDDGSSYLLTTIADNRQHSGQRHSHLIGQWPMPQDQRLTVDVLYKNGNADTGHVSAWGETVTYDFPRWFVRESYDPRQNFDTADVLRLSVGARF